MKDQPTSADHLFTLLARQERERQGLDHPTTDLLAACRAGELAPGQDEQVREHLAVCRECARIFLDLPLFQNLMETVDLDDSSPIPGETEPEASWQLLRARLVPELALRQDSPSPAKEKGPEGEPSPASGSEVRSPFQRLTTSPYTVYTLAAGLLACLIGFSLWLGLYGTAGRERSLFVVYPTGSGEVHRGGGSDKVLAIQLGEAPAVLVLPLPGRRSFPAYRLEIRTLAGKMRLSAPVSVIPVASSPGAAVPGAERAPVPGVLAVVLARDALPPGDYRLRIFGMHGTHAEALAEIALHVGAASRRDGT